MKQTIEIEVPDGKKAVWKDNKVIFEDIKPQLPKTWDEFCKNYPTRKTDCYIDSGCGLRWIREGVKRHVACDRNLLPSEQAAKAHIALMQLHQLRDCYRQGWKPNLKDSANKYGIQLAYNSISSSIELRVLWYQQVSTFLSFPTCELAEEFLTNFRELIEQAGDLI